ncbi:MAG: aminotransferase class I/II-fold pyridoxal phosphate-dependent enzyme [Thermoguttaceae bacterium]|nr:aminotransferase class I/II-fold pyridoxal phosphate-dependent enzyme [Thermoguttaceae bacterium]
MSKTANLPGSFFGPPTLVELIRHRAKYQPDDLAFGYLVDGDTDMLRMTNLDLDTRSRAIAAWLQEHGLTGERAMLLFPPGLDFIAAYFGCLYAGVVAVPVYPPRKNRSANRVQIVAQDCGAKIALTNGEVLGRSEQQFRETPFLDSMIWLNTDEVVSENAANWSMPDINGDTVAFLQYTSGSTGDPKGVVITHTNLMHNSATIGHAFEHTRTGIGVFWLPTYHDMGLIGGILQPLYVGRPNILMSPMAFLQRPFRWLSAISRYQATTSGGPNFAYELCVKKVKPEQVKQLDLSSWKVAFNGAEPVRPETMKAFAEKFAPAGFNPNAFYPCYGLAEATLLVSGGYVEPKATEKYFNGELLRKGWALEVAPNAPKARCIVGNGAPMPDQSVAIVNPDTEKLCVDGEVGEIWMSGPSTTQGYWKKPEVTAHCVRQSVMTKDGKEIRPDYHFFRTGDLGFMWGGELYVSGRLKDMIIWHGVNLYPQDIELTIQNAHELCRADSGAVFALEQDGREMLVLVQEVDKKVGADYAEVIEEIKKKVSKEHELPLDCIYLIRHGAIPKTSSGKIQRNATRVEFLADNFDPLAAWNALDGKIMLEAEFAELKAARAAAGTDSAAPKAEKIAAEDHDSEEIMALIPDLESRQPSFATPKPYPISPEPLEERLAKRAAREQAAIFQAAQGQEAMMGAFTGDEDGEARLDAPAAGDDWDDFDDDLESMVAALGGDGAGMDPVLEELLEAAKSLNTEGLPEELRQTKYVLRLFKIIEREVRSIARERAIGMTVNTAITELGMDSLERMEIINILEEDFGGRFPEMVLQDLITVCDVAEAICKFMGDSPRLRTLLTSSKVSAAAKNAGDEVSASSNVSVEIPEEYYVFAKSPEYRQLRQSIDSVLDAGLRNPYFTTHDGQSNDKTVINGKEYIHFSSYNYLGLACHPEVMKASQDAIQQYGCSSSASRLVSGQKKIHLELERKICEFNRTEDSIVFSAGHHTNESVLGKLCGKGDLILHDSLAHNSMVMGSILSGAQRRPFEHDNWEMVDDFLRRYRSHYRKVWIAIEGVYSMDGDIASIPEFIEVKKRHKANLYVDEAHSMGPLGPRGAGVCDYFGIDPNEGDIWMGTISKALASTGGYVSGQKELIEYLRYTTPGFVFSGAISPAATGAALAAIKVLEREPERVERLRKNSELFLSLAKEAGLNTGLSKNTPVIPIIYGNSQLSLYVSQRLFDRGINVQPIMHPAVEEKASRLRFFMTAIHTEEEIRYTVKALVEETENMKKFLLS